MSTIAWTEPDDALVADHTPYLSHSRINRYLTCPEQYRLHYLVGLRPRQPAASLHFGQVVHQALAHYFRTGEDSVKHFLAGWGEAEHLPLAYNKRDTWATLQSTGTKLLQRFGREEAHRISGIEAIEKPFEISITSLGLPFVGIIDLVAEFDGERTVIDFKTAAQSYDGFEVALSDQLTGVLPSVAEGRAGGAVRPGQDEGAAHRMADHYPGCDQFAAFLAKADLVAQDIGSARFYKRPGKHCAWCDFLPVCLRDKPKAEETLVQITVE
ncbi:MAG: hypothetical protein A49_23870 [Methyloceanibacter sp.]|nr:MAG: hypothetical protein A49_23870 [Methyloceanibacter sp.]